jgi:hypothetical protein
MMVQIKIWCQTFQIPRDFDTSLNIFLFAGKFEIPIFLFFEWTGANALECACSCKADPNGATTFSITTFNIMTLNLKASRLATFSITV